MTVLHFVGDVAFRITLHTITCASGGLEHQSVSSGQE